MVEVFASRDTWCPIIALAWMDSLVLTNLRKDPKLTIEQLATSGNSNVAAAAQRIATSTRDIPLENYSGYLPLPKCPDGLTTLDQEALKNLIGTGGISGVLQCDRNPEVWADVLKFAWSEEENLRNIRQDPLKYLPEKDKNKLLQTDYGILPVPKRPKGLDSLSMEQLTDFLGDRDATEFITGIWLMCT